MIWQSEEKADLGNKEIEDELKIFIIRKEKEKKKFKINNKLLVSLLLLISIIIDTTVNTYSWFTSSASSTGQITVGTFKLDLSDKGNANALIFEGTKLQPGVVTDKKTITFVNSGDIEMVLRSTLTLEPIDASNTYGVGNINAYKVSASIYKNEIKDENIVYKDVNGVNKDTFDEQLNSILDPKSDTGRLPIVFKPGEKLVCVFQFVLDGASATKDHQGDTVSGNFTVEARQNIAGASFPTRQETLNLKTN